MLGATGAPHLSPGAALLPQNPVTAERRSPGALRCHRRGAGDRSVASLGSAQRGLRGRGAECQIPAPTSKAEVTDTWVCPLGDTGSNCEDGAVSALETLAAVLVARP